MGAGQSGAALWGRVIWAGLAEARLEEAELLLTQEEGVCTCVCAYVKCTENLQQPP